MSSSSKARDSRVSFPLLAVYAACRLARERGDEAMWATLDTALKTARRNAATPQILSTINDRGRRDLIQFVRDSSDISVACAMGRPPDGVEWRLCSEVAGTDLGFLQIWKGGAAYVDRVPLPPTDGREVAEVMAAESLGRLMESLRQLDDCPAAVAVAEDPSILLEIRSEVLRTWPVGSADAALTLVRPDESAPGGWVGRRLSAGKIRDLSPTSLALRAPANVTMEVHAAALAGHWLVLTSPELCLLTPLPEFAPDMSVDAWLRPNGAFIQAVGADVDCAVTLPRQAALDLCRRHRWCLPSDIAICLDAAVDR